MRCRNLLPPALAASLFASCSPTALDESSVREAVKVSEGGATGTPWLGEPGINESVAVIMGRPAEGPAPESPKQKEKREHQHRKHLGQDPDAPATPQWPLNAGGPSPAAPQSIGSNFVGARLSDSGFIPPDSMGAIGPSQILICVNGRIRTFTRGGVTDGALNTTTDAFFQSVRNNSGTSDPRVYYDRLSQRWYIVMINVSTPNRVVIAVSSGATISSQASFTFFQFQHDLVGATPNSDTGGFADQPTLGVDANALYIGVNVFNSAGTSELGATAFVVRKSALLAGSLVVTPFRRIASPSAEGPDSPKGVDNDDPNATEGYFIGVSSLFFGRLDVRRISNPGGTPSISANLLVTVPSTTFPINVPAKGSTPLPLDGSDDRLVSAQLKHGSLWASHQIQVNASGVASTSGGRDGARIYELTNLTTTPTLNQSSTLFDTSASNPLFYVYPAVAASGQGHVAVGSSYAGVNAYAGVAQSGRLAGDALGTLQAPTLLPSSTAYNVETSSSRGAQRWGDYSFISVDPQDDMTMWSVQELCDATNSWGVQVIKLLAPPPATPSGASPAAANQGATLNVAVTGTSTGGSGFYDPGAAFAGRLAATIDGGGVTVNSVAYVDPTHFTLNVTIAAGAAAGARTITVTNPDGQLSTSTGALFTINPGQQTCTSSSDCGSGFCVDGYCCNTACGGGVGTDCQACNLAGHLGTCWVADAGTICRPTAGACDVQDVCDGVSTACPSDARAPDGSACSDGNACTQTDACQAGACTGTNPVVCSPLDQCHLAGTCDAASGACSNPAKPNGSACSDGNACTTGDSCQNGNCGGIAVTCSALDQCHLPGTCDPATGVCSNPAKPDGSACNDGNACTQNDTCQAGVCTGANPVVCTALDQCHVAGTCDPATGACTSPKQVDGTPCSDGSLCTIGDTCQAGLCTGGAAVICNALDQCHVAGTCDPANGVCSNPAKPNGSACSDGNACTTADSCQNGSCGGTAVVCAAQDQCHVAGTCDPASGACSNPAKPDGSACNDGNGCTQNDTCQAGACTSGAPVTCGALDQCHVAGSCDPATGACSSPAQVDGTPCNDGSLCTSGDSCQAGLCTGTAVTCNALDQCHVAGTCDPASGACSNPPKPNGSACSDGNACTTGDSCQNGSCGGTAVVCAAQDQCHVAGTCDPASGVCSNPSKPDGSACSDGNACTQTDSCQAGACIGANPVTCNALDQCHLAGTCDPARWH
jgi:hypothetical protein